MLIIFFGVEFISLLLFLGHYSNYTRLHVLYSQYHKLNNVPFCFVINNIKTETRCHNGIGSHRKQLKDDERSTHGWRRNFRQVSSST